MSTSNVDMVVKFDKGYYKLKTGEKNKDLPKDLKKILMDKNYIDKEVIATKPKRKKVKEEIIPEENLDLEEISDFKFKLEIPEEEHKIKEEDIFNYRKEDNE
jgi:hypothetical protein